MKPTEPAVLTVPGTSTGPRPGSSSGLAYGLGAYTAWGFIPLYFRALAPVPPWLILCHRVFWSVLFLALVVSFRREWLHLRPVLRDRWKVFLLLTGAILIALNWLIFIFAVATHQLLQASLGYFINPLLSVALGMIFLRERLRPGQWVAVLIALFAVCNLALRGSGFPWLAISLAGSFGFYGLVRKKVDLNSLHSLLIETTLLFPLALGAMIFFPAPKTGSGMLGLLSLSGIITAVPLLMFGEAVRRLRLSTVGFLQYVGPTLQFLVALFLFREPLDRAKLASFGLCWLGIAVYVVDSILARQPQAVADEPE